MAPEQARGEPVDPRADVFSVGCVLYELLTNERAFASEGVWMLPSFASVPAPLQAALERAIAIDPGHRFADAEAFLRVIAPILAEHAPTFGTRDLAAILAELFEGGWELDEAELGGVETPATKVTGAVRTFATRIGPHATPSEGPRADAPVELAARRRGRPYAWPIIALLAVSAGLLGYRLARLSADPQTPPPGPAAASTPAPIEPDTREPAEVRERPEPHTPAATIIELELSPADARVTVAGDALAGPPYTITLASDEPIELSVEHPDFRSRLVPIDPHATPTSPLRIELDALEDGSLTVLAPSVAWAEVLLDGVKLGTTPLTDKPVREGKHRLVVRCPATVCDASRVLLDRSIRIRPGRSLELSAEL